MGKRIVSILAALALTAPADMATAVPKSPKLAMCDGKHRRPANPYGSILPTVDPASGTSTPPGQMPGQEQERRGVEVFPEKKPAPPKPASPDATSGSQVPPISSLVSPSNYRSC